MEKEQVTPTSPSSSSSPSLLLQPSPHFHYGIKDCSDNNIRVIRRSKTARRKRTRHASCCCCTTTTTTTHHHEEPAEGMFDAESDEERAEVERKIAALQRIVPGGESLEVDRLFEETAEYILALEGKVIAMKLLTNLFQGLQKEETNVSG